MLFDGLKKADALVASARLPRLALLLYLARSFLRCPSVRSLSHTSSRRISRLQVLRLELVVVVGRRGSHSLREMMRLLRLIVQRMMPQ